MGTKKKKKSSKSSPWMTLPASTTFSSLPYDLALNIFARVSLFERPTLSLVSKSFRSIIASRELDETRNRMGITEDCLYVRLNLKRKSPYPLWFPYPRWFALAAISKQQKLMPIPSCPYDNLRLSTVVSSGSEIYIIGGCTIEGMNSQSVYVLNCKTHQWSQLENMRLDRTNPAAEVIDGKLYVIGGCILRLKQDWGEVYDPKTQTWEPVLSTCTCPTLDLPTRKSVVPGRLLMSGKLYDLKSTFLPPESFCLVEMDKNMFCKITVSDRGKLIWRDTNDKLEWSEVMGLEGVSLVSKQRCSLVSMGNSRGGRRMTIWWRRKHRKICCAEIVFESRFDDGDMTRPELWGVVEWSKSVFNGGRGSNHGFFMHSALVTL